MPKLLLLLFVLILVTNLLDNIDAKMTNFMSIILGDLTLEKLDQSLTGTANS